MIYIIQKNKYNIYIYKVKNIYIELINIAIQIKKYIRIFKNNIF